MKRALGHGVGMRHFEEMAVNSNKQWIQFDSFILLSILQKIRNKFFYSYPYFCIFYMDSSYCDTILTVRLPIYEMDVVERFAVVIKETETK